jgi:hypothetical protein
LYALELEKLFGVEVDEWLSVLSFELSPQNMEEIGSGGTGNQLNITLVHLLLIIRLLIEVTGVITEGQEPLESARTMLRSLSIHAMGQIEDQT